MELVKLEHKQKTVLVIRCSNTVNFRKSTNNIHIFSSLTHTHTHTHAGTHAPNDGEVHRGHVRYAVKEQHER